MKGEECFEKLAELSETFNNHYNIENDIFGYFNVFRTPVDVGDYLVKGYEESDMVDLLEERLGLSVETWKEVCNSVYKDEFMKRRFTSILNNRSEDMI